MRMRSETATASKTKSVDRDEVESLAVEDDSSLAVTWQIDLSLPLSERPMAGIDVAKFRERHGLSVSDAIYALCIPNSAKFNKICRIPTIPFTLELLIRLYDAMPSHAPWVKVTPQNLFDRLYGQIARDFRGSKVAPEVRLAVYRRFTAAMGRSVYTAYRWVQGHGNAKPQVVKIFAKLTDAKNPREMLEGIARLMYRTRNKDFDAMHPLPTLQNPPVPRRRGPKVGAKKKAAEGQVDVKVAARKSKAVAKAAVKAAPAKKAPSKAGAAAKAAKAGKGASRQRAGA